MEQRNALVVAQPLTPDAWQMIQSVAPAMHQARLFGVTSPEQAAAVMLKGFELGLSLTASFEFIQVIQGKPTLSPRGALALILRHPEYAGLKIEDLKDTNGKPAACRVTMKRRNGLEYTCEFSMSDAQTAGLVKEEGGWEKYPANMLRWRAVGFCADVVFPDVLGGMKRADELGADLTATGDVIDGDWQVSPSTTPPPRAPEPEPAPITLDSLVTKYGAQAIMAANGGKIPGTDAEIEAVAQALEAQNA